MGIPRLRQTLEPFAERAVLGNRTSTPTTNSGGQGSGLSHIDVDSKSKNSSNTKTSGIGTNVSAASLIANGIDDDEQDGCRPLPKETPKAITAVVIDGPALVYHVYHRILNLKTAAMTPSTSSSSAGPSENIFSCQPTYREINLAVQSFLTQLRSDHGITVEKIYFDGGLPASKRGVRLSRLETTRAKKLVPLRGSGSRLVFGSSGARENGDVDLDYNHLLLQPTYSKVPATVRLMPEPEFMVPAVLEDLLRCQDDGDHDTQADQVGTSRDNWRARAGHPIVEIVPGEADAWCAGHAARTGATILTSDSDLLVYDLNSGDNHNHKEASVVFLDSLELVSSMDDIETTRKLHEPGAKPVKCVPFPSPRDPQVLLGTCYHPNSLANRLGIPSDSFQRFCFLRSLDRNSSTLELRQGCRSPSPVGSTTEMKYQAFLQDYFTRSIDRESEEDAQGSESRFERTANKIGSTPSLQGLDPRLAELVTQLWNLRGEVNASEEELVNMYLPMLTEDPDRDSVWLYGKAIRGLAYSLLLHGIPLVAEHWVAKAKVLHEHQRRGARIASLDVHLEFGDGVLNSRMHMLLDSWRRHREQLCSSPFPPTNTQLWKAYGVLLVMRQRAIDGKAPLDSGWVNDYLGPQCRSINPRSWNDVHNHASLSAVLYSLRILKQVVELVVDREWGSEGGEPSATWKALKGEMETLPSIPELICAEQGESDPSNKLCRQPNAPRPWVECFVNMADVRNRQKQCQEVGSGNRNKDKAKVRQDKVEIKVAKANNMYAALQEIQE